MWPLNAVSITWSVKNTIIQSLLPYYTAQTGSCSLEGSIFKPCGATCRDTCTTRKLDLPVVCLPYCKPGCACPAGQVSLFCKMKKIGH